MKACPACARLYPADAAFCPIDGRALSSASELAVARDAAEPRLGQLVWNRHQIRRVIADGGMGRVYEALDVVEGRGVALKILHPNVAGSPHALERFRREFAISRELPHEHIVEVLDFRPTDDGSHALAMELLHGEDLRATLRRERVLAPARLVRLLSQVALGLDPVHARNFVHRDLKPDNLFLCQTAQGDTVKVLDFGSAKDGGGSAQKLTALGTTIGSPFYMAPEQAQGLPSLDRRADVWAMAAIAYECVTGVVPFPGNTGPSTLLRILTSEPDPPSRASSDRYPIPVALDAVLALALRKVAAQRTPTLGALADGVGRAYGVHGTHAAWALLSEDELARRIESRADSVRARARGHDPTDQVFGVPASLVDPARGVQFSGPPMVGGSSGVPVGVERSAEGGRREHDEEPIRIPTENRYLIALLLGGTFVLLALAAVLWALLG